MKERAQNLFVLFLFILKNTQVQASNDFDKLIERERSESWKYGGRTVFDKTKKPDELTQLKSATKSKSRKIKMMDN